MSKKCTKKVRYPLVKIEELKRKAVFKNPKKLLYEISRIDGCLINEGIRSDYLVSEAGNSSVIVELKGSDVAHACDQVLNTVCHSSVKPLLYPKIGFLVVCSKYPRFDTFVAKAKLKCARRYKAGFHVVCDRGEFNIDRVVAIDGPF